jgi:hypothetical protein
MAINSPKHAIKAFSGFITDAPVRLQRGSLFYLLFSAAKSTGYFSGNEWLLYNTLSQHVPTHPLPKKTSVTVL